MSTVPVTAAPAAAQATTPPTQNKGSETTQNLNHNATSQEIRKMKLKLDGREVELPESEVIAYAQQGKVANQRFQEAAQMRKEAEQVLQFAKQNPEEFFKKTGLSARQWAEEFLLKELQTEAMSPEQRKARENEEKLRGYETEKKQNEERARNEQMAKLEQEHMKSYDMMFTQALTESGLPRTAFTVKRMAELQLINIKNKYELSASQLAKLVREDYSNEQKSLLTSLDGDQLMEFLGPDAVKKFQKALTGKLKARTQPIERSGQQPVRKKTGENEMSWREYQKKNRGR